VSVSRLIAACIVSIIAALYAFHAGAEPRFSFETTPGKLPKDVVPSHYALRVEPGTDRFDGEVRIDIEVRRPVPAIVLNAAELDFKSVKLSPGDVALTAALDPKQETVALKPSSGTIAAGKYRLDISYSGPIARHFQGLYRISYKQNESGKLVEKTMLATHMEPASARRLFPGWDEPVYRAAFDIVAVTDASLTAVSNMPQAGAKPLPGGRREVTFATSPPMSTYLVALFIGEMDSLDDAVDGIRLRIYTAKGKSARARYAMNVTKQVVLYYNDYFGERYPLEKLDQIALPGGMGGAMENWGAIAYNEARVLYDPKRDPMRQRESAYGIIAHEIAHQWFGNLVTMAWWDNLWLNEGFASWMAEKTTDRFNPAWRMRLRYALSKEWALAEDARRTTHPIQTPVDSDTRATDVFDSISYGKGAAVLRMMEAYLGEDIFRDGIRRYVGAHRFSNTTTADLWRHLSEASGRDVGKLVSGWTEQPGYPVVKVSQGCESGKAVVVLAQERFTLNDPGAKAQMWNLPVILANGKGERSAVLLEPGPQNVTFPGCGRVIANAGDSGYYRVQYDEAAFRRVTSELNTLAALDRLRLMSDTFALVQAGRADIGRYLELVETLGGETERSIWDQAIDSLRFTGDLIDDENGRAAFDRYVVKLLEKPFARTGWDAQPGESPEVRALRRSLIGALGRAGYDPVVREAQARFAASGRIPIDPAIRPAMLSIVGRYADEATYKALLERVRTATEVEDKSQALAALRQMRDPKLVQRFMELMLTDELPPGEAVYNLTHLYGGPARTEQGWRFVLAHLPEVLAKASPRGRPYVLPGAASEFSDPARADELIVLTREHLEPAALYAAERTADWIRLKAAVKQREAARALEWSRGRDG
jgi:aminopeptidase N